MRFVVIDGNQAQSGISDEMRVKINGEVHWLWRAVDEHGQVLDILRHKRRDPKAAKRFFQKIIKKVGLAPDVVVSDKLKSAASST